MHFDEQIVLELQTSVHFPPEFWRKMAAARPVSKRRYRSLMSLRPAALAGTTSPQAATRGSSSRRAIQRESMQ